MSGDGLRWVLSLPWETFDGLNRATNAEFLDLVAEDVAERDGDRTVLVDGGITHPSVLAAAVDPSRIVVLARTAVDSADELAGTVMAALGIEGDDGAAADRRGATMGGTRRPA